ncbi:hypothetical protein [Micromonospora sp. WMMC250]|uniref:hypothetical protein n=1 Tax=Micromonospora sp. WMMC250 TaxID=3014781 RepID=UPI0022B6FD1F|nr:hypothetical protein [Micromonospora sp. WMMC250]MCZ7376527.1 hypothetical protein [Micromonospora sp. WMMC250]
MTTTNRIDPAAILGLRATFAADELRQLHEDAVNEQDTVTNRDPWLRLVDVLFVAGFGRPIPSQEDRMRDARTDAPFADRIPVRTGCGHTDGQDADDRSKDRAIAELEAELTAALGKLRIAERDRDAARDDAKTIATARNQLRADLDSTEQVARFREGVINLHAAELGAAGEVIAVVRDAVEQIERALARYDTAPEVTPVDGECPQLAAVLNGSGGSHSDASCGWCADLRTKRQPEAEEPPGSVSPRAQGRQAAPDAEEVARLWHNTTQKTRHGRLTGDLVWESLPQEERDLLTEVAVKQLAWFGDRDSRRPSVEDEQALRDRVEHAIRDRAGLAFPLAHGTFLDRVAAVAAVAAVQALTGQEG